MFLLGYTRDCIEIFRSSENLYHIVLSNVQPINCLCWKVQMSVGDAEDGK